MFTPQPSNGLMATQMFNNATFVGVPKEKDIDPKQAFDRITNLQPAGIADGYAATVYAAQHPEEAEEAFKHAEWLTATAHLYSNDYVTYGETTSLLLDGLTERYYPNNIFKDRYEEQRKAEQELYKDKPLGVKHIDQDYTLSNPVPYWKVDWSNIDMTANDMAMDTYAMRPLIRGLGQFYFTTMALGTVVLGGEVIGAGLAAGAFTAKGIGTIAVGETITNTPWLIDIATAPDPWKRLEENAPWMIGTSIASYGIGYGIRQVKLWQSNKVILEGMDSDLAEQWLYLEKDAKWIANKKYFESLGTRPVDHFLDNLIERGIPKEKAWEVYKTGKLLKESRYVNRFVKVERGVDKGISIIYDQTPKGNILMTTRYGKYSQYWIPIE